MIHFTANLWGRRECLIPISKAPVQPSQPCVYGRCWNNCIPVQPVALHSVVSFCWPFRTQLKIAGLNLLPENSVYWFSPGVWATELVAATLKGAGHTRLPMRAEPRHLRLVCLAPSTSWSEMMAHCQS